MNNEYIKKIAELWQEVAEKKSLDPVDAKALKGKHSDRKDKDIDNDGDVDKSDEYLHNRRKAVSKAMKNESEDEMKPCPKCDGSMQNHDPDCPMADKDDDDMKDESSCGDKRMKKESVELDELSDDDWVHINRVGSFNNPKKDSIVGYSKAGKNINRAPKLKSGANHAMRVSVAKEKGYVIKESQKGGKLSTSDWQKSRRESVELDEAKKRVTLGGTSKQGGVFFMGAKGIDDMIALSKKNPKTEYTVKSDNYGNFKAHWLRNGKFAKQTVANIEYDMTKNAVRGKPKGKDVDNTIFSLMFTTNESVLTQESKSVSHEQWGYGEVIETTQNGFNVYFEHGVEFDVAESELMFLEKNYASRTKGATAPEGIMDKESPKSKEFAKKHDADNPELAKDDAEGHEDATKAGRAVNNQAPTRGQEKRIGDKSIVNPVKGAVTTTTGKEG